MHTWTLTTVPAPRIGETADELRKKALDAFHDPYAYASRNVAHDLSALGRRRNDGFVLTSSAGARDGEAQTQGQSRHLALLTETEPGRRNRRTIDSVFLVVAAIVIGLSAAIASSRTGHDRDVGQALTTVLGWAGALWRAAFFGLLGLAAAIVVDVLLRRRWDLARDLLVAEVGAFGLAISALLSA